MQIIQSSNARAVASLLDARPAKDPALERRVAAIVERVRRDGDSALLGYARRFDGLDGPIEVSRREIDKSATLVDRDVRRGDRLARKEHPSVAEQSTAATWTVSPVAGVTIGQRVVPLDRVGCYVPGGRYPLPSSLLMTAIPARVAGVPEVIAMCPQPGSDCHVCRARGGRLAAVPARRRARHRRAGLRHAAVPRVDRIVGPGNAYVAAAKALVSTRLRDRFLRRPERDCDCVDVRQSRRGSRPTSSRRPSTIRTRARF